MYKNLEAEMVRNGVNRESIAVCIGKSYNTVLAKMRGDFPFTLNEAFMIYEKFFPNQNFLELFKSE